MRGRLLIVLIAVAVNTLGAAWLRPCPTDVTGDGTTDVDDLVAVILDWGTDGVANGTDVTGDGAVSVDDVVAVVVAWGPAGCPEDVAIELWYGDALAFGSPGRPHTRVNVLGTVTATWGIDDLVYTLNGGRERPLSWGSDDRRLAGPGDFNVELRHADLDPGPNEIVIRATDALGTTVVQTLTLDLASPVTWPLPYAIDWSVVDDLHDVVDVSDGRWELTPAGLRCTPPEYDRLVVLGDAAWTDYEVTVPITIHAVDPSGYEFPSVLPGVGLIARWPGHSDRFEPGAQPRQGWWPFGAVVEFAFRTTGCGGRFELYGTPFEVRDEDAGCAHVMAFEETWIWKLRVTTAGPTGARYEFRAWREGDPEPADWMLSWLEDAREVDAGCLALLAHHVDATYGDIVVVPVE